MVEVPADAQFFVDDLVELLKRQISRYILIALITFILQYWLFQLLQVRVLARILRQVNIHFLVSPLLTRIAQIDAHGLLYRGNASLLLVIHVLHFENDYKSLINFIFF